MFGGNRVVPFAFAAPIVPCRTFYNGEVHYRDTGNTGKQQEMVLLIQSSSPDWTRIKIPCGLCVSAVGIGFIPSCRHRESKDEMPEMPV